jgi:acyl-CoA synthetase (AMP-forming)/AMP-acid ligase II
MTWNELLAGRDPSAPAVISGDVSWSTEELLGRASGAAQWLDDIGVVAGAQVPALLTTAPDAFALTVAGAGSGRPVAPLGPRLTVRELAGCVEPLSSPVLVTESEFLEIALEVGERTGRRVEEVGHFPLADRALDLTPPPESTAAILHTSGTTGLPKAVAMRQDRLAVRVRTNTALMELGPGDVYASASPFQHIAGLGMFAVALGAGAAVACFPRFTVEGWRGLAGLGVTHALLVPTMIETLLDQGGLEMATLRLLQYGAAPIHPDTLRRMIQTLPTTRFGQIFGQTEGSPISCLTPADHVLAAAGREDLLASVGRAAPGVELKVDQPDGDGFGEVWARAPHLFRVDGDGWLRTGDVGRVDADGYLSLAGRKGDKIIRGGENVYPLEVEHVLAEHPRVREAVVVGVPDRRWGEVVKAYIVPADPACPPEADDLRAQARAQLAGFKVPTMWEFVADLPRNPQGKVLRRLLVGDRDPSD